MYRFLLCFALLLVPAAHAQQSEVFTDGAGAIRGYDPAAYFTDGRPVKGSQQFTYAWKGATWRFATAANRDRFAADPEKFAPRYGGWCAYGVAGGYKASIDPEAWSIVDGRLYLNYSSGVRRDWVKDTAGYIRKADGNWPQVLSR
jgi:YHS domain-containing protein